MSLIPQLRYASVETIVETILITPGCALLLSNPLREGGSEPTYSHSTINCHAPPHVQVPQSIQEWKMSLVDLGLLLLVAQFSSWLDMNPR
jgi:hypothetical protein